MSYVESFRVPLSIEQAKAAVRTLAPTRSVLLEGPPGVGKTELVRQAAAEAGLELRTLMAPQLAPEDVLGLPQLTAEGRTRFCPPEALVPRVNDARPIAILLDELPSAPHDTQRALHALLLDRAIGDYRLPEGSWVVAAGNRVGDRALARPLSTAVVNRLVMLEVEPSITEWLTYAERNGVRREIRTYLSVLPHALYREPEEDGRPISTPRSWMALSHQLDEAERANLPEVVRHAILAGTVSPCDAGAIASLWSRSRWLRVPTAQELLADPSLLPVDDVERWLALEALREYAERARPSARELARLPEIGQMLASEERAAFAAGLLESLGGIEALESDEFLTNLAEEALG